MSSSSSSSFSFTFQLPSFLLGCSVAATASALAYFLHTRPTSPPPLPASSSIDSCALLDFLLFVGQLKVQKRTGWVKRQVNLPESVADHQYRMAIMSSLFASSSPFDQAAQRLKLVEMSLIHDLSECITGDLLPEENGGPPKPMKKQLERDAIGLLSEKLKESMKENSVEWSQWLAQLYKEYEEQETEQATLVKQFDRVEMLIQALEYEMQQENVDLEEFFSLAPVDDEMKMRRLYPNEGLREIVKEIQRRRKKMRK
jgi:putative hydrolase of HD superfamily